jgi:hypothetical protein
MTVMAAQTYTATLITGSKYTLLVPNEADPRKPSEINFVINKPVVISEQAKAILEATAISDVTVGTGRSARIEKRSMFDIKPISVRTRAPKASEGDDKKEAESEGAA